MRLLLAGNTDRRSPRRGLLAAAWLLVAAVAGCASPIGQPWADFRTKRQIEKIAADTSFPTAAEAGLAVKDDKQDDDG